MVRLNRIYTRTGDGGQTRLAGGQQVGKDHPRIEAYGTVDELMAALGAVWAECKRASAPADVLARIDTHVRRIQNELFNLGAELATLPADRRPDSPGVAARHVEALEAHIDEMNDELEPLTSFVLPGGSALAAQIHVARTVCRRAEREVIRLGGAEPLPAEAVRYLNRLSDYLFVASRWVAHKSGEAEPLWQPEKA